MAQTEQFTNVVWTDDCGCYLTATVPASVITRCPLHEAAPALLEALEDATNGLRALATAVGGDIPHDVLHRIQHGVEAIAQTTRGTRPLSTPT